MIRSGRTPRSQRSTGIPTAFRAGSTRFAPACCCSGRWRKRTRSPPTMVDDTAEELDRDLGAGSEAQSVESAPPARGSETVRRISAGTSVCSTGAVVRRVIDLLEASAARRRSMTKHTQRDDGGRGGLFPGPGIRALHRSRATGTAFRAGSTRTPTGSSISSTRPA